MTRREVRATDVHGAAKGGKQKDEIKPIFPYTTVV